MKELPELILQIHSRLRPAEKASILNDVEEHISWLISNDFPQLVQLLYRLDVDEDKLRLLLQKEKTNSATLIANLITERQLQKAEIGNQKKADINIPLNER